MQSKLKAELDKYNRPQRTPISSRWPFLYGPAVFVRKVIKSIKNHYTVRKLNKMPRLSCVLARHSSLLYRKLGDTDMSLQVGKVQNLMVAISKLDGLVIPPGEIFSLWHNLGSITKKKGYTEGMLLSNGKVNKGLGGGLCQLSNFLFWILLHTNVEVIERHHHSVDFFPDSGRTLPFGSGATIFHNYYDLQIKNIGVQPLQISLWLTEDCLKGQILSDRPDPKKFHVYEKDHCFLEHQGKFFRYNELHRETLVEGKVVHDEKIITNFAPVIYPISKEYVEEKNYRYVNIV